MVNTTILKIENHFDATLVQLLGAVCIWRDIEHAFDEMAQIPFNHILGVLGRNTLATAIKEDRMALSRYRLHKQWDAKFEGEHWEYDHVFPLHRWKERLRDSAKEWQVNADGLDAIRKFVSDHYVIARIPKSLHRVLGKHAMPEGWVYSTDATSLWARYTTEKVTEFMGRKLILPDHDGSDFVPDV